MCEDNVIPVMPEFEWIRFFWFWERRRVFTPSIEQPYLPDCVMGEYYREYRRYDAFRFLNEISEKN